MINTLSGKLQPFQSLSKWKKNKKSKEFANCRPCLVLFDILYFNGRSLLNSPLDERRKLLESNFVRIPHQIHLSELHRIDSEESLRDLMERMMSEKEEGLVLKDSKGRYAPNKRHWLKMKRDYLEDGALADSADLIVLGAYKGSGKYGGKKSIFLMGTFDEQSGDFKTVCKAHNGLTDDQIDEFSESLAFELFDADACPKWLSVTKSLEPFWIVKNPKKSKIFEICGFEFSESKAHTATDKSGSAFSIRFPRITKIRNDKNWKTATNLMELRDLVETSRKNPSVTLNQKKRKKTENDSNCNASPMKKRKLDVEDEDVKMNQIELASDDRTICRFDGQCYRKNPIHFAEYQHPKKELAEMESVKAASAEKMESIKEIKEKFIKAANKNKENELKEAKDAYDEMIKSAKQKYEELLDKAQREFDENMVSLKQKEQFELQKIEKKYHPK